MLSFFQITIMHNLVISTEEKSHKKFRIESRQSLSIC